MRIDGALCLGQLKPDNQEVNCYQRSGQKKNLWQGIVSNSFRPASIIREYMVRFIL